MRGYPEHNFPAFRAAEDRFRDSEWEVVSPREIGEGLFKNNPIVSVGDYLRADLREVITCGSIALLRGWEASTGARCEVAVAITCGLRFYDAETMRERNAPDCVTIVGGYERPAGIPETLDALRVASIEFANATFTTASPHSKAEHLRREAVELADAPHDTEEMADVFLLLAHLSDGHDLAGAVSRKLAKNRARKWGQPDADGVVEHLEGAA